MPAVVVFCSKPCVEYEKWLVSVKDAGQKPDHFLFGWFVTGVVRAIALIPFVVLGFSLALGWVFACCCLSFLIYWLRSFHVLEARGLVDILHGHVVFWVILESILLINVFNLYCSFFILLIHVNIQVMFFSFLRLLCVHVDPRYVAEFIINRHFCCMVSWSVLVRRYLWFTLSTLTSLSLNTLLVVYLSLLLLAVSWQ